METLLTFQYQQHEIGLQYFSCARDPGKKTEYLRFETVITIDGQPYNQLRITAKLKEDQAIIKSSRLIRSIQTRMYDELFIQQENLVEFSELFAEKITQYITDNLYRFLPLRHVKYQTPIFPISIPPLSIETEIEGDQVYHLQTALNLRSISLITKGIDIVSVLSLSIRYILRDEEKKEIILQKEKEYQLEIGQYTTSFFSYLLRVEQNELDIMSLVYGGINHFLRDREDYIELMIEKYDLKAANQLYPILRDWRGSLILLARNGFSKIKITRKHRVHYVLSRFALRHIKREKELTVLTKRDLDRTVRLR